MKVFEVVIAMLPGGAALAGDAAFQRVQEELDWAQFLRTVDGEE